MTRGWRHLVAGVVLIACGLVLLRGQGLVSGGAPGLALVCQHLMPGSMGLWLLVVNIPFVALSWWAFGKRRTLMCVLITVAVALCTDALVWLTGSFVLPTWFVAPAAGILIGVGLACLLRQGMAIAGTNMLALYLEKRFGWHSARSLMLWDVVQLSVAALWYGWPQVSWSALVIFALFVTLRVAHRPAAAPQVVAVTA